MAAQRNISPVFVEGLDISAYGIARSVGRHGVPVYALNVPLICQSPSTFAPNPELAHFLFVPSGSPYNQPTENACVRSYPVRARFQLICGSQFRPTPAQPSSSDRLIDFDHV